MAAVVGGGGGGGAAGDAGGGGARGEGVEAFLRELAGREREMSLGDVLSKVLSGTEKWPARLVRGAMMFAMLWKLMW